MYGNHALGKLGGNKPVNNERESRFLIFVKNVKNLIIEIFFKKM